MSRLTNIRLSTSGNSKSIAKTVLANQSFQSLCERLTVKAYREILKKKIHKPEWEEDTFSANFKIVIEAICVDEGVSIHVVYQEPQLTVAILAGTKKPKEAKRMDLVFSVFAKRQFLKYGIEAKILTSNNTSTRNAKHLSKEYIVSGIDRFINGSYDMAGCMVGYVVSGKIEDTLKLINDNLSSNSRATEIIKEQHTVELHVSCYRSYHSKCTLKHFLFEFV